MEYKELLTSAVQSLKTNILRTSLTMLGIIIGISAVILISSIGQGAVRFVTDELSSFGTNYFQITPGSSLRSSFSGSSVPLTMDDVEAIESAGLANVVEVIPNAVSSASVKTDLESVSASIYGAVPSVQELLNLDLVYGEFLSEAVEDDRVIVLGSDVADDLFGENTDPTGEAVKINNVRFRVIGVSKSGGSLTGSFINTAAIIPLDVLQRDITGREDLVEIDISVANTELINETMDDVEFFLREYRDIEEGEDSDFTMVSFEETLSTVETITGLLTTMIAGISAISLLVGGVGVMNIMLVSVTERTKEIGLLKSVGAKRRDILTQFLIESVVMTVSGGAIGIVIGVTFSFAISTVVGIPFVVSVGWILLAVIVSSLVGVLFGLYPARRAARLSPIDALRHE